MSFQVFFEATWFVFLDEEAKIQVMQSVELVERERRLRSAFHDYSFVVFPMSKAYESFLKKFLHTLGLIDRNQYEHRDFRIGRSLNPDLPPRLHDEQWLFDDLAAACTPQLGRRLWDIWIECRNQVFHYFPDEKRNITLDQAERMLHLLDEGMRDAFSCVKRRG